MFLTILSKDRLVISLFTDTLVANQKILKILSTTKSYSLTNPAITFILLMSWNSSNMNLWVMILTVMPKKTKKLCLISLLTMNNLQLLFYLVLMTRISKISKTKLMHQFSQIKVILESLQMVIKFLISSWTAILKKTTFSHHSLKISQFIQSVSIPECLEKLLEWATIQLLKT